MKMKLFFFFLTVTSTFVFGEITSDIGVPRDDGEEASTPLPLMTEKALNFGQLMACPKNMKPHPVMTEDSVIVGWRCECKPSFLRFSSRGSCHEAYRQGPCPDGQYVNLSENEILGQCVDNPCATDGLVRHNGSCYDLGATDGPCESGYILGVDETTFRVECREISARKIVSHHPAEVVDAPERVRKRLPCPPGMGRAPNGACLKIWDDEDETPRRAARPRENE